jgi:serine phosphatase RsbU (regulator of sigma subunit)
VRLAKGDRLFFYTDGLPETMNVQRELLGFDGLPHLVHRTRDLDLKTSVGHIIGEVHDFRGDMQMNDDIVLIGIEIT